MEIRETHTAEQPAKTPEFLPVRLSSLRVDSVTDFDLYHRPAKLAPPVLYRGRSLPFTDEVRARLLEGRVSTLYIPSGQEEIYNRYVERNLADLIMDKSILPGERTQILYGSAQNAVREMMSKPEAGDVLPRSKNLVEHVIKFMNDLEGSFTHFLDTASFDYYTYTHSVNVCVYSVTLAQKAGFEDLSFLSEFGTGALLHDIGKGRVGPEIIHCETVLTDEQWAIMKMHPVWGHEILKEQGVDSEVALRVTRHHHEKMGGGGYPDGLAGDDIPPYVRVSTICDIFDALTTRRSYRSALQSFPALKLMREQMSDDLDPELFRIFVELMATKK